MLTIVTGLPGAGKTLNTLHEVHADFGDGKRQIFYNGIPELALPGWLEFPDPLLWFTLPDGCAIVIDEAQRVFPQRSPGPAPAHVSPFETHRHRGLDVWLIAQDAKLLDHAVRRLAGRHVHYWRAFGMERCTRIEWQRVVDPNDYHERKQAVSTRNIRYPRELYSAYRSATLHTVKRRIPWKLYALPALVVLLLCLAWLLWGGLQDAKARVLGSSPKKESGEVRHHQPVSEPLRVAPLPQVESPIGRVAGVFGQGGTAVALIEDLGGYRRVAAELCRRVYRWECTVDGGLYVEGYRVERKASPSVGREASVAPSLSDAVRL